jgi:hypothetical protein
MGILIKKTSTALNGLISVLTECGKAAGYAIKH